MAVGVFYSKCILTSALLASYCWPALTSSSNGCNFKTRTPF